MHAFAAGYCRWSEGDRIGKEGGLDAPLIAVGSLQKGHTNPY